MFSCFDNEGRDLPRSSGFLGKRFNYLKMSVQNFAMFFHILLSYLVLLNHKYENLLVDSPCLIERFIKIRTVGKISKTKILSEDLFVMTGFVFEPLGHRNFVTVQENNYLCHVFGRIQEITVTPYRFPHIIFPLFGLSYELGQFRQSLSGKPQSFCLLVFRPQSKNIDIQPFADFFKEIFALARQSSG